MKNARFRFDPSLERDDYRKCYDWINAIKDLEKDEEVSIDFITKIDDKFQWDLVENKFYNTTKY